MAVCPHARELISTPFIFCACMIAEILVALIKSAHVKYVILLSVSSLAAITQYWFAVASISLLYKYEPV